MKKTIRCTGSFKAVDKEGATHVIRVFTDIFDASTMGNPGAEMEGLKRLRTDNGLHVNRLAKGEYQIVETEQVLRSDDPNAP